ncbi:2-oxoacid:acceptor oxidoreductase family protein [Saccharopolyspora sp. WRP15-2]|uniref:2-oxoacid:acceptor oxidoreductase family protein n=1 Tax=Saccharopolyspora oryzae TaxID=2997343 RepID=A0ABT4UV09_9PSEU|nr:2-oxoacid:acceptor oxidoreductase family protein [Saccharopolyspora oryzae]MDA3625545.1 2-oxoacid:acceptor oxidoreductase family protein [Saccharopolyspora oryzae]
MEFEVLLMGIGGQGIQLIGKTLALAATREGRHAMLAAEYGGEMRGGPSQSTVVIGDAPLRALPILPSAASAIVANHKFSGAVPERLRPGGLLLLNSSIVDPETAGDQHRVVPVAATALAVELGAPQAAGFVLLGAFNNVTGLVSQEALVAAMTELLPPYRREHAGSNATALAAGAEAVSEVVV